jgi:hypothetical protein
MLMVYAPAVISTGWAEVRYLIEWWLIADFVRYILFYPLHKQQAFIEGENEFQL